MLDDDKVDVRQFEDWKLRDLNSGEEVEIISPNSFVLETVLLDSAYYKFRGKEYRFLLCKARELGLKVA
jgi:hypothetical protein